MKKLLILLPLLFIGFYGCENVDFGDTNVDDDAVTQADAQALMAGAMNRFFTLGGREYVARPTLYVQYQSQNVYTDESRYNEAPSTWTGYYVQTLSNLKKVVDINSQDEVPISVTVYGAPTNQIGVAELMSVLIWKRVTDSFGPVPYEGALGEENLTPAYTGQETIYRDLIARAKTARDMLDANLPGPTGDVVYGGDVTKWQKFANSFIMSLSMQLTKKFPGASGFAATEFSAALNHSAGPIEEVADEFWYQHQNVSGATNPYSNFRGADYSLSAPFVDALSGESGNTGTIGYSNTTYDERLVLFSSDTSLAGRPYGYESTSGTYAAISSAIKAPDAPFPYMTAAYTYLNRAEAAELGWTSEVPADMFQEGVNKSFETLDAHFVGDGSLEAEATNYVTNRVIDYGTEGALQVIREEKWVALFPNGHDAWSEWRRTGIPTLTPAAEPLNNGNIPRRYLYPADEAGVNTEAYNAGVNMLTPGQDSNTSRFWWDID
ncbi:SusD/RagB family nutrient-binding outer membrane lipoprotein [Gracilimonas tropica]|uniref:SusD/RagB family nutrient-binding outer membrane lipoprotein n=1 Tax=Gracilimonas tropica TaxID=454600 RepID=UPI00037617D0|nr:SusD/RagB family nutrient-binding outer membrane lipoprotein [Gracilimonas tropica]